MRESMASSCDGWGRKDQEREYEQDRGKISAANWCQRMTMLIIPRQALQVVIEWQEGRATDWR